MGRMGGVGGRSGALIDQYSKRVTDPIVFQINSKIRLFPEEQTGKGNVNEFEQLSFLLFHDTEP